MEDTLAKAKKAIDNLSNLPFDSDLAVHIIDSIPSDYFLEYGVNDVQDQKVVHEDEEVRFELDVNEFKESDEEEEEDLFFSHLTQHEEIEDEIRALRETFLAIYEPMLNPMPGPQEWPKTNYHSITPPSLKKKSGRPKKAKKRQSDEPRDANKVSKEGSVIRYGKCNGEGHNSRKCKNNVTDPKRAAHLKMKADKAATKRAVRRAEGRDGSAPQPANAQCSASQPVGSQVGGSQPTKLGVRRKQGNGAGCKKEASNEAANSLMDCGYGLFLQFGGGNSFLIVFW